MSGIYFNPLHRVFLNLSGGTVTGDTVFTQGLYANNLSGVTIYSGSTLLDTIITNIAASVVSSSASTLATYIQPGSNIITGGTALMPIVNVANSPSFNNLLSSGNSQFNIFTAVYFSGGTISGDTIYSGNTNLQNTFNLLNSQIQTKINRSGDTFTGQINVPSINTIELSGGTLFSGNTNLNSIFQPLGANSVVGNGTNTYTAGTFFNQSINVSALTINTLVASGSSQLGITTASSFSGGTVSGGTFISGGTDLNIYFNQDRAQINTKANLSGATFTGAISATAITNSQLTTGWSVYAGPGGLLKTNSGFTFDDVSKNLFTQNFQVGSSSLSGSVTIWGDVIMMGQAISAFTTNMFIEDNNISLNYNPTASTASTSLGAGLTIQDGSGVSGTTVFWDIRGTATTVDNRSFATNLNDIRIRESGTTFSPNGKFVLASEDILNGGSF